MNTSILRSNITTARAIAFGAVEVGALPRWVIGARSDSASRAYPKRPR